jgi:hypothetical protein
MKMKLSKAFLAMSVLVGVLVTPNSFMAPVKAVANVDILSHTGYLDSSGYYHVVGEVQNVGDQAVNFVKIEVTFYDSNNVDIANRFDLTMLYVLLAGRKSPFDIVLLDTTQSANVNHYSLSVTFLAASSVPIGLEILSHSAYEYGDGFGITGEIMNIGTEKANNVKVIATYHDRKGKVVAASFTYLHIPVPEESDIDPGQTAQFEILLNGERTPYVYTYELTAESLQYACVSECVGEPPFLPTDLNKDGVIDILDIAIVAKAYGATPQHPRWNPIADLDENGIIDIVDVAKVARDYGKTA